MSVARRARSRSPGTLAATLFCVLLALPARAADAPPPHPDDPLERFNRTTYGLNVAFAGFLPAISMSDYTSAVPAAVRQGIDNVFINLREPAAAASALVAGNLTTAWNATSRFVINSTAGAFGTHDVAVTLGYPSERSDLGLELCRNGFMREPMFIELPILGPANLRDIGAQIVTNIAIYTLVGRAIFYPYYVLDRLDMYLERRATNPAAAIPGDDPYAARRDAYLGVRRARCDALTATVDRL
jgi:phospholipid-binding lipoprotein MlaA